MSYKKVFFRYFFLLSFFVVTITKIGSAQILRSGIDYPAEIENPEITGINKEAYHATLMPYASLQEALRANRKASTFALSLNGTWKFNGVPSP